MYLLNYKEKIAKGKLDSTFSYLKNSLLQLDKNIYNSLVNILSGWEQLKLSSIGDTESKEILRTSHSAIVARTLELIDYAEQVYRGQIVLIIATANNYDAVESLIKEIQLYSFPFSVKLVNEEEFEIDLLDRAVAVLLTITNVDGKISFPESVMHNLNIWESNQKNRFFSFYPEGEISGFGSLPAQLRLITNIRVDISKDLKHLVKAITEQTTKIGQASDLDSRTHPLQDYPIGPMVEYYLVDRKIKEAFAKRIKHSEAKSIIDEVIRYRKTAEADNSSLTYIRHIDLPQPEIVSTYIYWQDVFNEACLHGPRMLAAILLVVPDFQFSKEVRFLRKNLLEILKSWEGEN